MTPRSSHEEIPWQVLARYFAGELSPSEADELQRWIDADPARSALVDELRGLWTRADTRQGWDADAALRQIKRTAARPVRVLRLPHGQARATPAWRRVAQVAAALALVIGGGLFWRAHRSTPAEPEVAVVSTPRGQRAALRLPDGTDVVLAPASTIRYAVAANRGPRSVELEGEASFRVTHDQSRPFVVRTRHGLATDLGTRFVVHAYPDDSAAVVAVAEGKVSWRRAVGAGSAEREPTADSLLLVPHTAGLATASGRLVMLPAADVQRFLGWLDGRLEFHETPMTEVAAELSRWYRLDLRLADTVIARKRLSASFKDEPVAEVLRLLAATLDARVDLQGNLATLHAR